MVTFPSIFQIRSCGRGRGVAFRRKRVGKPSHGAMACVDLRKDGDMFKILMILVGCYFFLFIYWNFYSILLRDIRGVYLIAYQRITIFLVRFSILV